MAITITAADVKRKVMIDAADATYDSSISSLVTEMQGPIEYSIADCYMSDTANVKLQATLKLGMLEIIAGEFLEQLRREVGSTEQISINGVSIGEFTQRGLDLIQQGATRLSPYLKSVLPMMSETASISSSLDCEMTFATDEEVW